MMGDFPRNRGIICYAMIHMMLMEVYGAMCGSLKCHNDVKHLCGNA